MPLLHVWTCELDFKTPADGEWYLSASPQEAEQVSVLQLLHDRHQRSPKRHHAKELWQEGMRPQLGQEGCKVQEAVSLSGVGRVWSGQRGSAPLQTPGDGRNHRYGKPSHHLEPAAPHSCCPYGPCRETRRSRRAGRRWWAGG